MDYEPIDLSTYCNAGTEVYERCLAASTGSWFYPLETPPPIGLQEFHGLPFLVGTASETRSKCFILLGSPEGGYRSSLTIPVQTLAETVIFAHALLETKLWQGGPLGLTAAHYIFQLENGESIRVPIRERFEVGNIPLPWGQYPFLSLPDQKQRLFDRMSGPWEKIGFRATEVTQGVPRGYYLWVWKNPNPKCRIRAIDLEPSDRALVVAAITLGHLAEDPLFGPTRSTVEITIKQKLPSKDSLPLEVKVDRGVATYVHSLPERPLSQAISDLSGFGAPLNVANSPAFTEVSAVPSATVSILHQGVELGSVRWAELRTQSSVETPEVRFEIIDPGKNWVRVTVLDDDTGEPIPCRIAFHNVSGVPYPPHGHHSPLFSNMRNWNFDIGGDVRLGQFSYGYINGTCEGWLPRGSVLVDVARGFEYEPLRTWAKIEPGQRELTLRLKRWISLNDQRYFSGDCHVHFVSTQGAHLEAAGEDLNIVNLLLSQWGHLFTNAEDFTGQPSISQDKRTIVFAGQENRQHVLGHLTLLNLKSPIMPWCTDGPDEAELGGDLESTLSDWADRCHAQGGTVIIPHLPTPNCESAVLIATGRADAVEILEQLEYEHLEYYRYLNGGYRLPLVGGTDKMDSQVPVGLYRTYAYLPPEEEFTYVNWCKALQSGNTFVSGGALLWFTVEGLTMGSTVVLPENGGTVEIEARARSIFPIHTLQIVQQGRVIAETTDVRGTNDLHLKSQLYVNRATWFAARCGGLGYTVRPHFDSRNRGIMAHSSPVYVSLSDEYSVFDRATADYMLTLIEGGLKYIRQRTNQLSQDHVMHHHGERDHREYLERPFEEAKHEIQRRIQHFGTNVS